MLVSLKKLKKFVDFDMSIEELDDTLTMLGIEVDGIINYSDKYKNFFIGEVTHCEKHPNADKLTVCEVSIAEEKVSVVCGAPNVALSQKIVIGKVGAIVPNGGFKLEKRKIRDVVSTGMICSKFELDLGEDEGGIWVLPDDAPVGVELSKYLSLDDIVLELGLTPNKSDCLSHLGIARELAAKLSKKVLMPEIAIKESDEKIDNLLKIEIKDTEKCPRYAARIIRNVKIQESPEWLKKFLKLIDIRPVNAAVDVTNYVLFELGQPLHAFDFNCISDNKIIVRAAEKEEKFTTLDGKERQLDDYMVAICDGQKTVALGGVMGGENSEITDKTTNILLESAYFDPSTIRKTAKVLGLASDSSYRFERGTDPDMVITALNRAAALIAELCDGSICEGFIDVYPYELQRREIDMRFDKARKIIGISIENQIMIDMLCSLGFDTIDSNDDSVKVRVPLRRNDVFGEIDLIEEIARLYNYDNITPNYVSSITFSGEGVHHTLAMPSIKNRIREYFVSNGFNEILTQNMIDSASAGLFTDNPVKIANPLGEELSAMRPSLIPSILKTSNLNIRYGNHSLKMFEIGKVFEYSDDKTNLLEGFSENEILAVLLTGKTNPKQWAEKDRNFDFYDIKGQLEDFCNFFNLNFKIEVANEPDVAFSPNSCDIIHGKQKIGIVGDISQSLLKKYDIESSVYVFILNLSYIYNVQEKPKKYEPVSALPGMSRDLAFIVAESINSESIRKEIIASAGKLLQKVDIFDVYQGKNMDADKKSLAYNLYFAAHNRTLTESEVEQAISEVVKKIEEKFSATLRKI